MKVTIHSAEIECPDKPYMLDLVNAMTPMQAWTLSQLQKQPKNWPNHNNIPSYCIYMGSGEFAGEKVDFYHYEAGPESIVGSYSTAIVFGDFGGDYRSGWPELAAKRDFYQEQLKREFKCGFLTVDDLVKVGLATLHVQKEESDSIRPPRKNFRLGPAMDEPEDEPSLSEQDEPEQMATPFEPEVWQAIGKDFRAVGDDIRKAQDEVAQAMGIPAELMEPVKEHSGAISARDFGDAWVRATKEAGWCAWFTAFWSLFFLAAVPGAYAMVAYTAGERGLETWCLGVVGLVATVTAGWWITRGQAYRRVKA
jgi:hypothetical protein